jgi:hypothetical protein
MEVGEKAVRVGEDRRLKIDRLNCATPDYSCQADYLCSSVADPDPSDPYVFGPPGSGSISQRYGSGSRSFYHQAKIVRKTLIPTALYLLLFDFLSLKNDVRVNVPSKYNKKKNSFKISFLVAS